MKNTLDQHPFFSVIIPTRNRPKAFEKALQSVLAQSFQAVEIIVINDGSDKESLTQYQKIANACSTKVRFFELVYRPKGHGSSYARNYGVQMAKGQYVCFLDDDDLWTDSSHLQMAFDAISSQQQIVDAYYTNQKAYFLNGNVKNSAIWLEDLIEKVDRDSSDCPRLSIVDIGFLLQSKGFAHLNCSIIRKAFYNAIEGMDEDMRYESDRDLYLRTIDAANGVILFNPCYIARHHIPDSSKKNNVSTASSDIQKLIYQLRMSTKGVVCARSTEMQKKCSTEQMYVLKKITEKLYRNKEYKKSASFSRQALALRFSLKWFVFSIYLGLLSFISLKKMPNAK